MRFAGLIGAALLALGNLPATAQGPIDESGTVTHRRADARFPERIGEFRRDSVRQFDPAGDDIAASYWLVRGEDRLLVTVYIYPAGRFGLPGSRAEQCAAEFEGVGAAIVQNNGSARRIDAGEPPPVEGVARGMTHRAGYRMEAEFDGRRQPVRSEAYLYCFVGGRWQVKYRVTSNAAFDGSADVERLIRTGPWPGRAAAADPNEIATLAAASAP